MLNSDHSVMSFVPVDTSCSTVDTPSGAATTIPPIGRQSAHCDQIDSISSFHPFTGRSRSPSLTTMIAFSGAATETHRHPATVAEAAWAETYATANQLRMTSMWEDTTGELLHKACNGAQQHEDVMSFAATDDAINGDFSDEYSLSTATAVIGNSSTSNMKLLLPNDAFGDDDTMDDAFYVSEVQSIMRPQEPPLSSNLFPDLKRANPITPLFADQSIAQNNITEVMDNQGDSRRRDGRHGRARPPISVLFLEHRLTDDKCDLKKRMFQTET
jgi:hypothetical protein